MFVEEATQLEDLGELAHLRSKTRVPLATGERLVTAYAFSELCARHLVDYVQPDVVHCGGILEMKKIAAIADAFRIQLAPHNPQSEVITVASLHVDTCTPNCVIQEQIQGSPWQADLFETELRIEEGYAPLPAASGLGLGFNETEAAKHPYVPDYRPEWRWEDGAVADW